LTICLFGSSKVRGNNTIKLKEARLRFWLFLYRTLLSSQGFHGAVLITACIVLGFLVVGNGLSTYSAPSKQEKSAYPLPRLDLAKYSKDMGYIFAAGGYV